MYDFDIDDVKSICYEHGYGYHCSFEVRCLGCYEYRLRIFDKKDVLFETIDLGFSVEQAQKTSSTKFIEYLYSTESDHHQDITNVLNLNELSISL
jgi:hypothetical protein